MSRQHSDHVLRSDLNESCREAFCTSVLLTGNVTYAESVVVEALQFWTPKDTAEGALIRYVIDRSVEAHEPVDIELASRMVSEELRPVLMLRGARRHCFVLRILGSLSKQACASILGITLYQVDTYTSAALTHLAELSRQEPYPRRPRFAPPVALNDSRQ